MKKGLKFLGWSLSLIFLVALVIIAISLRPQGNSQGGIDQTLKGQLEQLSIPVKSVKTIEQTPLQLEVVLQSPSIDEYLSQVDLWDKFLAEREIDSYYLNYGVHIDSYRLVVLNSKDKAIYDSTIFLNSDMPSQKITPVPPSKLTNNEVKDILAKTINSYGLKLTSADVSSNYSSLNNGNVVVFYLSIDTNSSDTFNSQINNFIVNIQPQIVSINSIYGAHIVLVRSKITDAKGQLLVDYMIDIETGRQSSWNAENIDSNWSPQPAPLLTPEPLETYVVSPSPTSIPLPLQTNSAPTSTGRSAPYPQPTTSPYP